MEADYGMLMARTDFDAPKHAGISWFALPLDQPGVTIRPLREMTGRALFNEVFFDDAIVDDADLIGGENNGWAVANTTLLFERTGIGAGGGLTAAPHTRTQGQPPRDARGRRGADPAAGRHASSGGQRCPRPRPGRGRTDDPHLRQKLARLVSATRIGNWTAQRVKAEAARGGDIAGVANLSKLQQTQTMKLAAEVALDILGPEGLLWAPDAPDDNRYAEVFNFVRCMSIAGGTDEINKNVVGERALGLPREPNPDRGLPFREVLARTKPAAG